MTRCTRTGRRRAAAILVGLLVLTWTSAPSLAQPAREQQAQAQPQPIEQAMTRVRAGDLRGGIEILEEYGASANPPESALAALGALHLEAGNPQRAMEVLLPLVRSESPDPAVLYNAGRAAEALGGLADAAALYDRSIAVDGFSPALRALGMLLGRLGRPRESYELLDRWLARDGDDHPARIAAAAGAVAIGLPDEAEAMIEGLPRYAPAIRLLHGQIQLERGDPWGALGELQALADDRPPGLEVDLRRTLARTWLEVGDPEAAIAELEAIPQGDPSDALRLASAFFQAGRFREAADTLAPLAEPLLGSERPENSGDLALKVLVNYGRYLQAAGDAARSLPFLQLATELEPAADQATESGAAAAAEAWSVLADAMDATGRPDEATAARERGQALAALPTSPSGAAPATDALFAIGSGTEDPVAVEISQALESASSGNLDATLERISDLVARTPGDPRPAWVASSLLLRSGRAGEALEAAEHALGIAPKSADGLYQRAVVLMALDRLGEAEESFRNALAVVPTHPAALSDYAVLLTGAGRHEEAAGLLVRLDDQRPGDARLLATLGRALLDARRFEQAEETLRRATALEPRNPSVLLNLASALWEQNRPDEAEARAREAVELLPDSPGSHRLLGGLLLWRGKHAEAVASLEAAIANGSDDAPSYLELARAWAGVAGESEDVAEQQSAWEQAETAYRLAAELAPEHPDTAYGLAQVLTRLGRHDEAGAEMERYRALRDGG